MAEKDEETGWWDLKHKGNIPLNRLESLNKLLLYHPRNLLCLLILLRKPFIITDISRQILIEFA